MSQFSKDLKSGTHFLASIKYIKDHSIHTQFVITYDGEFLPKSAYELTLWASKRYGLEDSELFFICVDIISSVNYTAVTAKDKQLKISKLSMRNVTD